MTQLGEKWKEMAEVFQLTSISILIIRSQRHLSTVKETSKVILNKTKPLFLYFLWFQHAFKHL